MKRVAAIIVAAGSGNRMGGGKLFRALGGLPVIRRAIAPFAAHEAVGAILPVIREEDRARFQRAGAGIAKLLAPIPGGRTRTDSVRAGLERLGLEDNPPEFVLIHDGARPLCPPDLIGTLLHALESHEGAAPALPATDSMKKINKNERFETLSRSNVFHVQTPQAFHFEAILNAHRMAEGKDFPDDMALAAQTGRRLTFVPGAHENIKLTYEEDLAFAERLLGAWRTQVGHGFDAHRFEAGDHVMLGGVAVPHEQGLAGHSDADPLLHALTDALLGAVGGGDIGQIFPSSDPRWKNADSARFVSHALNLIQAAGGKPVNADLTLIAAAPALAPHREKIRRNIAALLDLDPAFVNVKATTTDGMGFTASEGIAAHAIASCRFPPDRPAGRSR